MAIDLGHGTFLTAAHVVDGDLRSLTLDEHPAVVVALDLRLDLAVIALENDRETGLGIGHGRVHMTRPIGSTPDGSARPGPVTVLTSGARFDTEIVRLITLRVDDVSARVVYERPALELGYVAEPGHSGAPVVDPSGALVGVVVLSDPNGGRSYAVRPPASTSDLPAVAVRRGCPAGSPFPVN